jgi:hypothetical protein
MCQEVAEMAEQPSCHGLLLPMPVRTAACQQQQVALTSTNENVRGKNGKNVSKNFFSFRLLQSDSNLYLYSPLLLFLASFSDSFHRKLEPH